MGLSRCRRRAVRVGQQPRRLSPRPTTTPGESPVAVSPPAQRARWPPARRPPANARPRARPARVQGVGPGDEVGPQHLGPVPQAPQPTPHGGHRSTDRAGDATGSDAGGGGHQRGADDRGGVHPAHQGDVGQQDVGADTAWAHAPTRTMAMTGDHPVHQLAAQDPSRAWPQGRSRSTSQLGYSRRPAVRSASTAVGSLPTMSTGASGYLLEEPSRSLRPKRNTRGGSCTFRRCSGCRLSSRHANHRSRDGRAHRLCRHAMLRCPCRRSLNTPFEALWGGGTLAMSNRI
jgi:hypothetical protein